MIARADVALLGGVACLWCGARFAGGGGAWVAGAVVVLVGSIVIAWIAAAVTGAHRHTVRAVIAPGACAALVAGAVGFVLATRALDGLHPPRVVAPTVWLRLLTDPSDTTDGAVQAEARIAGKHVLVDARGAAASDLARATAGTHLLVQARLRPVTRPSDWSRSHHLAARATIGRVVARREGSLPYRVADGVRSLLLRSAAPMPPHLRALFAGFVLGDDRGQAPEVTADFRASGLSHLLVVSGQNLAFVTGAAAPLLRRAGSRWRLALGLLLVGTFALVTRFEPSVLRAASMAVVALGAGHLGRPQPVVRVVGLAVGALLLVDPLLVRSAGFALSVGACLGIALLDAPVRAVLVGGLRVPSRVAVPLATTLAAQVGTAPVLVPIAGGIPVASLPANLLALPAAAPVMAWGVAAGIPAGLLGRRVSALVHLPTQLALQWVAAVARRTGSLPLGSVGFVLLVALVCAAVALHRARGASARRAWSLVVVLLLVVPALGALHARSALDEAPARSARLWMAASWSVGHRGEVLVVGGGVDAARLLDGLRRVHVTAVDLLVVASGGRRQDRLVRAVAARVRLGGVLAGHAIAVPGVPWQVAAPGMVVRAGGRTVTVDGVDEGRLAVTVAPAR